MHNDKEVLGKSFETLRGDSTPLVSGFLHENLCEDQEIIEFIDDKIETWTSILDSNPLITEDEKDVIKGNFQSFTKRVENNKLLYNKYRGRDKELLEKIICSFHKKDISNSDKKKLEDSHIKTNFIGGNIVINVPDSILEEFFEKNIGGLCIYNVEIGGISYSPIIVGEKNANKNALISHELQHFYNKFLINNTNTIENTIKRLLTDETICQTIDGSFGKSAEMRKSTLANEYSYFLMNFDSEHPYVFSKGLKGILNDTSIMAMTQNVLEWIEYSGIARELRDAGIENYADILAITPIDKRKDLKKIYLSE